MARNETDREDLIRDAVALTERAELQCPDDEQIITVGFRHQEALSIYFGQDPVYQFDPEGRLRRAFVDGLLFRSHQTTLAQLRRVRTESSTLLLRHDLTDSELQLFCSAMREKLQSLCQSLQESRVSVLRAVPDEILVLPKLVPALRRILDRPDDWLSTAIRARRI